MRNGELSKWARLASQTKHVGKLVRRFVLFLMPFFEYQSYIQTGEMVIHNMRKARPAYNVISNNCQNYAVSMLDAIQIGAHREFATSFAVYQAATGDGSISDLFEDKHPEEQKTDIEQGDQEKPEFKRTDTVQNAQIVMDENTTKLDDVS